ncbi:MAG: FKBP-type peptidyl-prolyl cis-trans isomerase [Bacteroidota bacterium]
MSLPVEEHHIITIAYDLLDADKGGELLERMDANYPFYFLYGTGKLLPAFEDHLCGLTAGDTFDFTLSPKQAYGPVEQGNIIDVTKEAFKIAGSIPANMIIEGNYVQLTDDLGDTHSGKILSFTDTHVKVDFNHSMAGKNLRFKGVVLNVRKATIDELVRKHYIQEDGIHRPDFGEFL